MKNKNVIRALVVIALFAWPTIETYRYVAAVQELQASAERVGAVSVRLASLRSTHVAGQPASSAKQ